MVKKERKIFIEKYKKWLFDLVDFDYRKYGKLGDILYDYVFYPEIERDQNRIEDGRKLREEYLNKEVNNVDIPNDWIEEEISVLEVLIALARRIEADYIGDPGNPKPGDFFHEMLQNLGLMKYDDRFFSYKRVNEVLEIWIDRAFGENGYGSPFPVELDDRDQRDLEIWSQAMSYIKEKYL